MGQGLIPAAAFFAVVVAVVSVAVVAAAVVGVVCSLRLEAVQTERCLGNLFVSTPCIFSDEGQGEYLHE